MKSMLCELSFDRDFETDDEYSSYLDNLIEEYNRLIPFMSFSLVRYKVDEMFNTFIAKVTYDEKIVKERLNGKKFKEYVDGFGDFFTKTKEILLEFYINYYYETKKI